jgi:hypothetical protein
LLSAGHCEWTFDNFVEWLEQQTEDALVWEQTIAVLRTSTDSNRCLFISTEVSPNKAAGTDRIFAADLILRSSFTAIDADIVFSVVGKHDQVCAWSTG